MDRLNTPPIPPKPRRTGSAAARVRSLDQVAAASSPRYTHRPQAALRPIAEWGRVQALDVLTVSEKLAARKLADEEAGILSTLVRDTPTAANVRAYALIVRERSLLRSLISAGTAIVSSVYSDEGLSARELVNAAESRVFEIAERGAGRTDGARSVRSMLPALIDQIDSGTTIRTACAARPAASPISTG